MAFGPIRNSGLSFESAVPMLVVGAEGIILQANAAVHRLLGHAPGSLVGAAIGDLAPESESAAMALLREASENAANLQIRSRVSRADGRVLDVRMTVEPCVQNGNRSVDVFVSYQPMAPWEAQREAQQEPSEAESSERLAG